VRHIKDISSVFKEKLDLKHLLLIQYNHGLQLQRLLTRFAMTPDYEDEYTMMRKWRTPGNVDEYDTIQNWLKDNPHSKISRRNPQQ